MKHEKWIVYLLLIAWCGVTHSELDTLEKFRTTGWALRPDFAADVGTDLILMGDAAVPFLIQTLGDETLAARGHAADFLRDLFPDRRALPALTEVFLHDANLGIRRTAAEAIACIDAEVARNLMFQHLEGSDAGAAADSPSEFQDSPAVVPNWDTYAGETTQDIAVDMLSQLQDKRVIPTLVKRLADRGERMDAAFALAKFKDKRAVPVLLDIMNGKEGRYNIREAEAVEALAKIGDERAVPVLLNFLDLPQVGYRDVVSALPQFGASIVPQLLEKRKQTESREFQERITWVVRHLHQPELAPVFGQLYLESEKDDSELHEALSHALKNMGIAGFEELVRVAQQKANYRALSALATYNSAAAVDAVAALALDKSYPLRLVAIQTLGSIGKLGEVEISTYLQQLLSDAAPEVKLYTMDIIRQGKLVEMAPALQELTQTDNEHLQQAAHYVLAVLADEMPLKLEVKMSRPRYAYGINTDIVVSYRIMNLGTFPIQIALTPCIREFEIQQPDGTLMRRRGPLLHTFGPSGPEDFHTLMPSHDLTMNSNVSKAYWLDQVGRYTLRPRIHTRETGLHFGFMTWTGTLTAPDVHFELEPPTAKQIDAMFAQVETDLGIEVFRNQGIKTLCQLAELRIPGALPSLKKLALTENLDGNAEVRHRVLSVLGQFASPELNPLWIQRLEKGELPSRRAIETLIESGETRAIALIRRIVYQRYLKSPSRNWKEVTDAALTLQRPRGDNTVFEWLWTTAEHKIRHWTRHKREEGMRILHSLWNPNYQHREPPHVFTNPWFYLQNAASRNLSEWEEIREKSITFAGLEELLGHAEFAIRRAAAYELAYRGNTAGIHLIEPDLHAAHAETRLLAREALVMARVQE